MSNSVIVDDDVKAVAEFMQTRIAASRLVGVADGLAAMAPLLWGRYERDAVQVIRLEAQPITADAAHTPLAAIE